MKSILKKPIHLYALSFITLWGSSTALANPIIAQIPEASGISFCKNTETLIVANDEGSFYRLSKEGKILSQHTLGRYDLEGVVCEEKRLVFAVETGALLFVDRKTLKQEKRKLKGKSFTLSKKAGIEGIAKKGEYYYLSLQAKKKKNAKLLVVKIGANHAKVVETIKHGIIDAAGLQFKGQKLYIVSDKKDKLYLYNLKKKSIEKKIKLEKFAQEGITFDNHGNIYFADDNGGVLKYDFKALK